MLWIVDCSPCGLEHNWLDASWKQLGNLEQRVRQCVRKVLPVGTLCAQVNLIASEANDSMSNNRLATHLALCITTSQKKTVISVRFEMNSTKETCICRADLNCER